MVKKDNTKSNTVYFIIGFTMLAAIIVLMYLFSINFNNMFNYTSTFYKAPRAQDLQYATRDRERFVTAAADVTAEDFFDLSRSDKIRLELEVVSVLFDWASRESNGIINYEYYELIGMDSSGALWAMDIKRENIKEPIPTEAYEVGCSIVVYGTFGGDTPYEPTGTRIPQVRPRYIDVVG